MKININKVLGFFAMTSALLLLINGQEVYAQSYSLSVAPSLVEIMIKPGKSITQSFKVVNLGDETVVTPLVLPLKVDKDTGSIAFSYKDKLSQSENNWFSIVNEDIKISEPFFLKNNESKEIVLQVSLPEKESTGDRYVMLALNAKSPSQDALSSASIEAIIGANILITVTDTGKLIKTGKISQYEFPIIMDSFDTLEGDIKLENTGATFFKPQGKITINGPLLKQELPILEQNILKSSKRIIRTNQDLVQQKNDPSAKSISLKGIFFGPYTVNTSVKLDGTNYTIEKKTQILAIPWKGMLGISVIICSVYIFIRRKR